MLVCLPFVASCSLTFAYSANEEIQALVVKETLMDRKVTVLELGFHFVTTIQLPEAINSIVIGDPGLFKVEHSEKEPQLVFVKPTSQEIAQTNLLITTVGRRQIRLLLRTDDQTGQAAHRKVHFLYKRTCQPFCD
jgi:type IV secretory pathway VirB9-like protein